MGGFGALRGCPDLHLITGNQRGAVLRLQGEMVHIGREIFRLDLAVARRIGLGPQRCEVAVNTQGSGLLHTGLQNLRNARVVQRFAARVVPNHFQ